MINNRGKNNIAKKIYEDLIVKPKEEIIDICTSQTLVIFKKGKEVEKLNKENKELKEDLEEYKQIGIMQFNRPYAKRYLEELRKEQPNLLYPDSEKIYEDYYELRDRIERANNFINQVLLYRIPNKTKEVYDDIERLQSILNGSDKE